MSGQRGSVSDQREVSGQRGEEDRSPRDGYYRGRYTSYWNASLFSIYFIFLSDVETITR